MSYYAEFAQSLYEAFFLEFEMRDVETGDPLLSTGIEHQLKVVGQACDYGDWITYAQVVASNSNGLIYATAQPGVSAIKIPASAFSGQMPPDDGSAPWMTPLDLRTNLRCALLAIPSDPVDTKVILTGTISFGERTMNPRLSLKATPFYPAPLVPVPSATQVKIQLATITGAYDAVEAALPASPLDPARITWATGGSVAFGGPLSNVIASALAYSDLAMKLLLISAIDQPT